jgi:flavorubredoxin
MTTSQSTGTRVDEIADGIYRISTPVPPNDAMPPGFSFNRYLVVDDAPMLYHTGLRTMFAATRAAIETVMPVEKLRYVAFSHVEADEMGALNRLLEAAPDAQPLCGDIAAMVSIGDMAERAPRGLADGESLKLGRHEVTWLATPHLPHAWECGHMFESTTETLFCGDLFTQPGADNPPLTEGDILEPSEQMRAGLDYFSHTTHCADLIEKVAATNPKYLACMHGAAWKGDGAALLRALGERLDG